MKHIYDYLNEGLFDDDVSGDEIIIDALKRRRGEKFAAYYERLIRLFDQYGYKRPTRFSTKRPFIMVITPQDSNSYIMLFDVPNGYQYSFSSNGGATGKPLSMNDVHIMFDVAMEDKMFIRVAGRDDTIVRAIIDYVKSGHVRESLFDDDGDITIEALMHRTGETRSEYYERINNLCNVHGYEKPSRYIKGCYYIVVTLMGRFLHIEAFDTADNCVYMIQQLGASGKLTASSEHVNPDSMREYITRTARNRTAALDDSVIRICDKTDVIYDAIVKYVREHEK